MSAPLHTRLAVGAALGAGGGLIAHALLAGPVLDGVVRWVAQPIGQIYLRLLLMLVVPVVFSALTLGVAGLGDLRRLGRVGLRTLAYTVLVSGVAVAIGLTLVNLLRPGDGVPEATRARLLEGAAERAASITSGGPPKAGVDLLLDLVPKNPIAAAANGDMLGWMFFAFFFGVGLALTETPAARRLEEGIQGLFDVSMRLIHVVIGLSPYGVAALLFSLTSQLGVDVLLALARYVAVVLLALALHQFGVYALLVRVLGRMRPLVFYRAIQPAMITAFSTASSNATLPTALEVAEDRLRLPRDISRFVLTIGSTANQNGTALFEGVTVLFLAQFYGVELSLAQQATVMGVCVLGGVGTAGVPAGSIPVIALILGMVGVPVEGIGLILGVDRLLDMCRTTLNVTGDLAAAVVISARSEGDDAREGR